MKFQVLLILLFLFPSCKNGDNGSASSSKNTFLKLLPSEHSGVTFKNDIKESFERNTMFFDYFYNGGGVSIGDINNDGLADIFFTGNDVENKLYLNKGDLKFEDISASALGIQLNKWSTGSNFIDINNDGFLDIYVCNAGPYGESAMLSNDLYINNGDLTFTNKAQEYGLDDDSRSIQAGFFDYDNDGDLDAWINTHSNFEGDINLWLSQVSNLPDEIRKNQISKLYKNENGKFEDVSKESGILSPGFNLGLSIFDINDDGWLDVYVANDYFVPDFCYINDKNGKFNDHASNNLSQTSFYSMGSDAADVNNDGILDLAVVDMTPKDHIRNKVLMESMNVERFNYITRNLKFNEQYMFNTFQIGLERGGFSEVGKFMGMSQTDWSWAPLLADFDNDGHKDLYVTNGYFKDTKNNDFRLYTQRYKDSVGTEYNEKVFNELASKLEQTPTKNYIFYNSANGKFEDVSETWTDMPASFSNGAAYGDLDNDGDLDLVINNLGQEAAILINESKNNHYLKVKLHDAGKSNPTLYSQVYIYQGKNVQRADNSFTRGYQSSVEPIIHFGLGNNNSIDSIKVIWPDFTQSLITNVIPDQLIKIDKSATPASPRKFNTPKPSFINISSQIPDFRVLHLENYYDDFYDEILLPHKYSIMGPPLAVGDLNNDGLQDFYLGGSKNQPGQQFMQSGNKFVPLGNPYFKKDEIFEDLGALFIDVDADGDLDLYVASGGGGDVKENLSACQDRLYINQGGGLLKVAIDRLPEIKASTKSIIPIDFDNDGDKDLFVGGRNKPGAYPLPEQSFLLQNDKGYFKDVMTPEFQKDLPGMITDGAALDIDSDGDEDLILVGEWTQPKIFINENGVFKYKEIPEFENLKGWWQSLRATDLDNDGDLDFVLGNIGENNKFQPTVEKPLNVLASDFDNSGTLDVVLTKTYKDKIVPVRGKECSSEQMPFIKEKFPSYKGFASSSVEDILGKENISKATKFSVNNFSSVVLINNGNFKFEVKRLPNEAQWSPMLDIIVEDYNQDGKKDLVVAGNIFDTEPETPAYDSGKGIYLIGNGDGTFKTSSNLSFSGLYLNKNVKAIEAITLGTKQKGILVANNSDFMELYLKLEK